MEDLETRAPSDSNQRRSSWRAKCRERLAAHIEEALGLQVKPDDVRLKTDEETRYEWQVDDPSLWPFFNKQLSKHSVGAYMALYYGVGNSFRAVEHNKSHNRLLGHPLQERVYALEVKNQKLTEELKVTKEHLGVLEKENTSLEKENTALMKEKTALKENVRGYEECIAKQRTELEDKVTAQQAAHKWMSMTACYQAQCSTGLSQAISFLEGLRADISPDEVPNIST
ncbi:hypothetical protein EYZ11_006002 [Aspergillus tanneri]|uniref:Uncharacterized protein n=1 Tax=Aspergillus tanneri TaxID=1220188 RepID=A0A4S3JGZ5_9EURO|nr:uncharacterized protein ATNIH1004_011307 [Aspergillus tanneri]KAA8642363.1 hypothetical protein ATNIH1004_011307 [Aspergillus tanneri]THC94520.1 hypothetical protein EYZ11_006002 [Aspergillus tanneri]